MSIGKDVYIEGLEFAGGFNRRLHGYSSALGDGMISAQLTSVDRSLDWSPVLKKDLDGQVVHYFHFRMMSMLNLSWSFLSAPLLCMMLV